MRALLFLPTSLLLLPSACGYQVGFTRADPQVQTVAIQVVRNKTFRQQIERPLTRQLFEDLNVYTDYRHASKSAADAVLTVTLTSIINETLVAGDITPVEEGSIDAVAQVRLVERRTGRVVVERIIRDVEEFRVPLGENLDTARAELVSELSKKIMLALERDF